MHTREKVEKKVCSKKNAISLKYHCELFEYAKPVPLIFPHLRYVTKKTSYKTQFNAIENEYFSKLELFIQSFS
jgi:hypothetical protein